jgi:alanine racemase
MKMTYIAECSHFRTGETPSHQGTESDQLRSSTSRTKTTQQRICCANSIVEFRNQRQNNTLV